MILRTKSGFFSSKALIKSVLNGVARALQLIITLGVLVLTSPILNAQNTDLIFTRTLERGMRGEDVRVLQQKLQDMGFMPKNVKATNYFGPGTENGVKIFQEQYGIASSGSPETGYGILGPKTRLKFHEILGITVLPTTTENQTPDTPDIGIPRILPNPSGNTPEEVRARINLLQDQIQALINELRRTISP